ncbi:restriction endonuclease subunit S [Bacillus sp. CECT 9360]|uniref:restriction endonuclease subunit S n=1 Tax=Bacillus sp. CECT 9360 TaxID=2845821 RepID=UPI001E45EA25|nr:restriction endonuclease subunit S [Bacillus sp. CECT 9360]CAH0346753.1 hypothetical protein BCI9360_03099 [Bacillus sp. CECT 9360]
MSDKITKSPQIRFAGFIDAWEHCRLGDVTERVTRKNKDLESTLPLTISAQYGLVDQETFFKKVVASKDISGYYLLMNGEFAYNKSYSKDYPWGAVKRLDLYDNGVLSTLYITFKPMKVDSDFLVCYYDTHNWHKEIAMRAAEGARNHGLLNITAADFFDTELFLPKTNDEQQKVGSFFKQLDETITLHQRKLELLRDTKKSLLQKMFPKDGANVPEIRFAGFNDAWEKRKIGEIFKVTRGQVLAATETSENKTDEMPYPVYSSQTKNNGLMGYYKDYLFDTAITWTTDGANAGTVNYRDGKFYSTNVNGVLLSDEGYANKAVAEALNCVAWKYVSRVGNPKLMNNIMSDIMISLPLAIEEQNMISEFFESIDHLITLHQRELNSLDNLKKSLLQHMFV